MSISLKAPFPYFGGKSRVAQLVWERFGDVPNYVEPFFGSGAVLLGRPEFDGNRIETVNDLDGFLANFWRALQYDPAGVAQWADWPVNELDLHARHDWLVNEGAKHVAKLNTEPDYYDVKIAGWWVWGLCAWIGSGWCTRPESQQRPHLRGAGQGVHRTSQQLPHLGDAEECTLREYFEALAKRLRRVRVCCGSWERVCKPTVTAKHGIAAVFLDPPYCQTQRDANLYAVETPVAADVRAWCAANGDNPELRIALCGYVGEGHETLESLGWECVPWKAEGGYGNLSRKSAGRDNAKRERIWFSPHCLPAAGKASKGRAGSLFAAVS